MILNAIARLDGCGPQGVRRKMTLKRSKVQVPLGEDSG